MSGSGGHFSFFDFRDFHSSLLSKDLASPDGFRLLFAGDGVLLLRLLFAGDGVLLRFIILSFTTPKPQNP